MCIRGEIYNIDLKEGVGSEQRGIRPCVIISNDVCNKFSPVITIVPITSKKLNKKLPTHVPLDCDFYGLFKPSIVLGEQVISADKERIVGKRIAVLSDEDIKRVEEAVKIQLGVAL